MGFIKRQMQSHKAALLSIAVVATVALGANVTLPFTYTPGTTARASEVNANFTAVKTAVDDNNTRLTTAEGGLTALTARVAALESQAAAGAHLYAEQGGTDANANVDDVWVDVVGTNIPLTLTAAHNVRYQMLGRLYNYGSAPTATTECSVRIVKDTANTPLIPPTVPTTTGDWWAVMSGDANNAGNAHQVALGGLVNLPAGTYNFKVQVVRKARVGNSGNCQFSRWPFSKARLFIDLVP